MYLRYGSLVNKYLAAASLRSEPADWIDGNAFHGAGNDKALGQRLTEINARPHRPRYIHQMSRSSL